MNTQKTDENNVKVIAVCCGTGARWMAFWGIILVLLGGLGLLSAFTPIQPIARYILPGFLVVWGAYLLLTLFQARAS